MTCVVQRAQAPAIGVEVQMPGAARVTARKAPRSGIEQIRSAPLARLGEEVAVRRERKALGGAAGHAQGTEDCAVVGVEEHDRVATCGCGDHWLSRMPRQGRQPIGTRDFPSYGSGLAITDAER